MTSSHCFKGDSAVHECVGTRPHDCDAIPRHHVSRGPRVPKNVAKGESTIRTAAGCGDAGAQLELGEMLLEGSRVDCVKASTAEALEWFRKAAEQGCPHAQMMMGDLKAGAYGCARNMKTSFAWYQKAAEQNEEGAFCVMGDFYKDGAATGAVARDYSEALRWYARAREQGNPNAQNNIDVVLAMKRSENETGVPVPGDGAHVVVIAASVPALGALDGVYGVVDRFVALTLKCLVRIQRSTEELEGVSFVG